MSSIIARENVYSDSNINKNIIDGQNSQVTKNNENSVVIDISCCNNNVYCNNNVIELPCCRCKKNVKSRLPENFLKFFVRKFFRSPIRGFKKVNRLLEKFLYSIPAIFFHLISDLHLINLIILCWNMYFCKNLCLRFSTIYLIRRIFHLFLLIPIFGIISLMLFLASFFFQLSSCKEFLLCLREFLTLIKDIIESHKPGQIRILMYFCEMILCKIFDPHSISESTVILCSLWYLSLLPMIAEIQNMIHRMVRILLTRKVRRQSYFSKLCLILTNFFGKFFYVLYICIHLFSIMIVLLVNIVYIISDTRQESKLVHTRECPTIESLNFLSIAIHFGPCDFCVKVIK